MKTVSIICGKNPGNYENFLVPLWVNRQSLQERDIQLRFFTPNQAEGLTADIVICTSYLGGDWPAPGLRGEARTEATFGLLSHLKENCDQVFWFDVSDSGGSNQFRYLPKVDKFLKAYVLKDRHIYQQPLYRDRLFTDYYHKTIGISEPKPPPDRVLPQMNELAKIHVAWSGGLGDYGRWVAYFRTLRQYAPLPFFYTAKMTSPTQARHLDVNMRFSANYNNVLVAYQRQELQQQAARRGIPTSRIRRAQYLKELQHSKVIVSPFGWGEVCYRDYEAILSGAALLKPDMSHIETWPPLYKPGETYLPFSWDLSDWEAVLDAILHENTWLSIAKNAQADYQWYLFEKQGREAFCEHFTHILIA